MEFRYLKTLIPVYGFTGFKKPGRYRQLGRGVTLQFMKDGEWQDIEEVTEVKEW